MTILKYVIGIAIVVAVYWGLLYVMQRRLMYPAPPSFEGVNPPQGALQIWLDHEGGRTEAWWLPPTSPGRPPHPVLIYGHGNGELIDYWSDAFDDPREWGVAALLVEYPGYGRSGGTPSEEAIGAVFEAAYDWALTREDVDPKRIIGYGRSLGGGALAKLSRERSLAALILESTFTSTLPFARRFGAPAFLVRDSFDTLSAIERFGGAIMVLHGVGDEVIPIAHGRTLAHAAGVTLHELPCGHNDCPPTWPAIQSFLIAGGIISTQ